MYYYYLTIKKNDFILLFLKQYFIKCKEREIKEKKLKQTANNKISTTSKTSASQCNFNF